MEIKHYTSDSMVNIYVGNLPFSATEQDLHALFAPYGEIVKTALILDRETGRSRGFGFVEMPVREEALKAIEALNGSEFEGRNLTINEARPRGSGGGGGGSMSQGDRPRYNERPRFTSGGPVSGSRGYGNSRIKPQSDGAGESAPGGYRNTRATPAAEDADAPRGYGNAQIDED